MENGIRSLLPEEVEIIAGPGCPVCVVPSREIFGVLVDEIKSEAVAVGIEVVLYVFVLASQTARIDRHGQRYA